MTPQEAKDQAASEFNMPVSVYETLYPEYLDMKVFNQIINRSLDIMWNAAIDAAAAAEEHFGFGNEELISKQSILKLKR